VPPTAQVRAALASLGVEVGDLAPVERQDVGAAEYVGHDREGHPLKARVLGKDAQDTQRLARRWLLLAYRDPPRRAPIGRLEQIEHEALATLVAAQAGVRVPAIVTAALGPDGDALVVTRQPDTRPLEDASPDSVADETLEELWRQVDRLHAAGISHGRLNLGNIVVDGDAPMLVDLSAATLGAPRSALDIDMAELLVACTVLVAAERALGKAVEAGRGDVVTRALPYLHPAALTPHLRDLARAREVELKALRSAAAAATGQQVADVIPMRRIRLRDLLVTAMIGIAVYLLISQLADIGFRTIANELRHADVAWIVVGLVLAQLTFIAGGNSLRGTVMTPLALLPCVVLQSAIKFINLTVPSSAGRIAISIRFLQADGCRDAAGRRGRRGRRRLRDDRPDRALPARAPVRRHRDRQERPRARRTFGPADPHRPVRARADRRCSARDPGRRTSCCRPSVLPSLPSGPSPATGTSGCGSSAATSSPNASTHSRSAPPASHSASTAPSPSCCSSTPPPPRSRA
jgi:tRNA A-37 threonylcarbamoyl transferase component Bud32